MRKTVFLAVVIIGTAVFASQASRNPVPDEVALKKAVLEVHAQMAQAEKDLNAEKFFEYILDFDNGLIMQDGTVFNTRQEALEAVRAGFERVAQMERNYERADVTALSPDAALVTSKGTSKVTLLDGRTFTNPFAASTVFVRRDGRWKLLHGHYSPSQSEVRKLWKKSRA